MKKLLFTIMLVLGTAASSWAYTINFEGNPLLDVGGVDSFVAASIGLPNSGDGTELAWVRDMLGDQTITGGQIPSSGGTNWIVTNESGSVFAFDLGGTPDYFLIKLGKNDSNPSYEYLLFKNLAELEWAVVGLNLTINGKEYEIKNIAKISHVAEFGGAPVPEPRTIMLLGSGLAGLALFGRRNKRS